eukprot:700223-Rhodomonas_salina.1
MRRGATPRNQGRETALSAQEVGLMRLIWGCGRGRGRAACRLKHKKPHPGTSCQCAANAVSCVGFRGAPARRRASLGAERHRT